MALEDRRDVVSIVEETHALIGNSLATEVPPFLVVRVELLEPLQQLLEQPLVDDPAMVELMASSALFVVIRGVVPPSVTVISQILITCEAVRATICASVVPLTVIGAELVQ